MALSVTLNDSFCSALRSFLAAKSVSDPPTGITLTTTNFVYGRYQASPEDIVPIVSVHVNNPLDASDSNNYDWRHERRANGGEMGGPGGCAAGMWDYRFSVRLQYFMTRSGESQDDALDKGYRMAQWLVHTIGDGSIGIFESSYGFQRTSDFGETALKYTVSHFETHEGGGPGSYIMRATIFLEMLVMVR